MCYFNGQKVTRAEYIRLKELEIQMAEYDFLVNDLLVGFDYGLCAVLKPIPGKEDITLTRMEWGFIFPGLKTREEVHKLRFGYKDANGVFKPPIMTLNAVAEEMLSPGKIYRDAALHRRCLVLSSGFYEWRHVYRTNKKTGQPLKTPDKYPYYIKVKDREYFFMAGIWQPWTDKATGEYVESFAIVTTAANTLMEKIHNSKKRMPAILSEDLAWEWLFGNPDEKRIREIAMTAFPAEQMEAYTIAKDFRETLEPTKPYHYGELMDE